MTILLILGIVVVAVGELMLFCRLGGLLSNLQDRRFWVEAANRWVRLRISNAALRLIDKVGIEKVLVDLRARGEI